MLEHVLFIFTSPGMLLFGRCQASAEILAQQFPKLAHVHVHYGALTKSHCYKVQCNYSYSIRIRPNSKDPYSVQP